MTVPGVVEEPHGLSTQLLSWSDLLTTVVGAGEFGVIPVPEWLWCGASAFFWRSSALSFGESRTLE